MYLHTYMKGTYDFIKYHYRVSYKLRNWQCLVFKNEKIILKDLRVILTTSFLNH